MPTLIRRIPPPPNVWVQLPSGLVGKVEARPATILHCFSGRAHREDGLAAALTSRGLECAEVDTVIHSKRHDLLDDDVYDTFCQAAQAGEFQAGVFGVPCSTFSVARIPDPTAPPAHPTGPTCVRGRDATDRHGLPGLDASQQREVDRANELMRLSVHLATLIHGKGGAVVFENPPDRGCADSPDSVLRGLYEPKFANHCPLWLLPEMRRVQRDLGLREVTFAQCQLCGSFQKWTTLWYSHTLAPILDDLHMCVCTHADGAHPEVARGRTARGDWISAEAAAYPAQMNALLADAIEHHCVNLPHADSRFNPAVQTWYAVGPTNHITKC